MNSTREGLGKTSDCQSGPLKKPLETLLRRRRSRGATFDRTPRSGYAIQTGFLHLWPESDRVRGGASRCRRPEAGSREVLAARMRSGTVSFLEVLWTRSVVKVRAYEDGILEVLRGDGRIIGCKQGTLQLQEGSEGWTGYSFAASVSVKEEHQGRGVATAMYDAIDWRTEAGTTPSSVLTEAGRGLWTQRLEHRRAR